MTTEQLKLLFELINTRIEQHKPDTYNPAALDIKGDDIEDSLLLSVDPEFDTYTFRNP